MIKKIIRKLLGKQQSHLCIVNADGSGYRVAYTSREWIEAPNWSRDGKWLVFNSNGLLHRLSVEPGVNAKNAPIVIDTASIRDIGNDHVISPDSKEIYFTAHGVVYRVSFTGGIPQRVSPDGLIHFYVHGISPDGLLLSCVGYHTELTSGNLALYLLPSLGGESRRITYAQSAVDGAEFSPDGNWIYFNGELQARRRGDSQLFKMRIDGGNVTQLSGDERVNWFPHISPDGKLLVYLSYAEHTQGHPANQSVILRCLNVETNHTHDVISIRGGQGTFNTNSWAPDSTRFAFVCYSDW